MVSNPAMHLALSSLLPVLWLILAGCNSSPALKSAAESGRAGVEANLIIGTQAIGGPYRFTEEPYLLEVARELAMDYFKS